MIDPCGMVMDYMRMGIRGRALRSYYATARIRENPELLATIRYYLAPPGAKVFPAVHAFGCNFWERGDWDAPRTGLGVVDFNFTATDRGIAPLGVSGQGTVTPLDWFLNGVPANVTGPYPNGRCTPLGEPMIVRLWANPGMPTMQASLPTAGLTVMQYSIVSCCNGWQVHLSVNDPAPGPGLTVQSFAEASFPGYAPQSPGFSTTQEVADGSSVMSTPPIVWTRGSGTGSQSIYWAYVTDRISGALITAGRFAAAPITVALPGDQVQLQTLLVQLSPFQPVQAVWTGQLGLGFGLRALPKCYRLTVSTPAGSPSGAFGPQGTFYLRQAAGAPGQWYSDPWTQTHSGLAYGWYGWAPSSPPQNEMGLFEGNTNPWTAPNYGFTNFGPWDYVSSVSGQFVTTYLWAPPTVLNWTLVALWAEDDVPLIGSLEWDGGNTPVPSLYLLADGSAVSRTTYSALFARYGTFYGPGDGSTTFNLPDVRGRTPRGTSPGGLGSDRPSAVTLGATGGGETHAQVVGELAAHNHPVTDPGHTHGPPAGSSFLYASGPTPNTSAGASNALALVGATGSATTGISTNNTGSGTPMPIMNPNMGWRPLIYAGV